MKSLKQFIFELQAQGVKIDESNLSEIKHSYRKKYKALMNKEYNQKNKRRSVVLTREEDQLLLHVASTLEMKPGTFIKRTLLAVLHNKPTVVALQDSIHGVVSLIARVGNLTNQLARKCNSSGNISHQEILSQSQILRSLDRDIRAILSKPIDLVSEVQTALRIRPKFVDILCAILLTHYQEHGSHRKP